MAQDNTRENPEHATTALTAVRVGEVADLLLAGKSKSFIIRHCKEHYDLGDSMASRYIRKATAEILEICREKSEETLAKIVNNLWALYYKQKDKEPIVARQALMDIARLMKLDQFQVNVNINRELKEVSDQDLDLILMEQSREGGHGFTAIGGD